MSHDEVMVSHLLLRQRVADHGHSFTDEARAPVRPSKTIGTQYEKPEAKLRTVVGCRGDEELLPRNPAEIALLHGSLAVWVRKGNEKESNEPTLATLATS
jgi:hypothetical protein